VLGIEAIIHSCTPNLAAEPPAALHQAAYPHLACPAGIASIPPSDQALLHRGYARTDASDGGAQGDRASDSIDACVGILADLVGNARRDAVDSVYHCQATLNETITESTCLRIGFAHFPKHRQRMTLGQVGTSGVPLALQLCAMRRHRADTGALIAASDSWTKPFLGSFGDLVNYRNAHAAMLVRRRTPEDSAPSIADIHGLRHVLSGHPLPFWERDPDDIAAAMVIATKDVIAGVMNDVGWRRDDIHFVAGETYGRGIPARIAESAGLSGLPLLGCNARGHDSSAAFVTAVTEGVALATGVNGHVNGLIWSASPCGASSAAAVTCYPSSMAEHGLHHVWISNAKEASA
jgi:hypothetical protein